MTGDVAIIVPMLGRPHRVEPLVESIEASTPEPHRVLFVLTPGDRAVEEAVAAVGGEAIHVNRKPRGDYARKINTGVRATTEPFVFTGADDLRFHPEWLPRALAKMTDRVGVVGTNDLCNRRVMRGLHATHFLVARWYITQHGTIDEPGKVFHEGYPHELVDDEMVGTAKHRKAWAFARDSCVEHLHPMVGKAPVDRLYAAQGARIRAGRPLFERRREQWT